MTTRRIGNGAALYRVRVRPPVGRTRTADHDLGIIAPIYRGWRLACTGAEIERLKRWINFGAINISRRYPVRAGLRAYADRQMRNAPKDWTGK